MSIATRSPIVATILTTLYIAVGGGTADKPVGHAMKKGTTYTLRCVPGKPISATPLATSLGVNGIVCKNRIVRKVTVSLDGKRTVRVGNKIVKRP